MHMEQKEKKKEIENRDLSRMQNEAGGGETVEKHSEMETLALCLVPGCGVVCNLNYSHNQLLSYRFQGRKRSALFELYHAQISKPPNALKNKKTCFLFSQASK